MYFHGEKVESLYLTVLEIVNTGNIPIKPDEFVRTINVTTGNNTRILNASVVSSRPVDLDAKIQVSDTSITLDPILLNEKDSLRLKIISTNRDDKLMVSGRVVGVASIERVQRSELALPFLLELIFNIAKTVALSSLGGIVLSTEVLRPYSNKK